MAIERTFIAVKPDGVRRRLVPDIMSRFERRGYVLVAAKLMMPPEELIREHYKEHAGKPFVYGLIKYMGEGPVFAMIWEGEDVIAQSRRIMGATKPSEAAAGTIRFDYAQCQERNLVHGSDSTESAEREINLWFNKSEVCDYDPIDAAQLIPA